MIIVMNMPFLQQKSFVSYFYDPKGNLLGPFIAGVETWDFVFNPFPQLRRRRVESGRQLKKRQISYLQFQKGEQRNFDEQSLHKSFSKTISLIIIVNIPRGKELLHHHHH